MLKEKNMHSEEVELKKENWTIAFNKKHPHDFEGDAIMLEGYIQGREDQEVANSPFSYSELCVLQQALDLRRTVQVSCNNFWEKTDMTKRMNEGLSVTTNLREKVLQQIKDYKVAHPIRTGNGTAN